jgi:hypothetical protein
MTIKYYSDWKQTPFTCSKCGWNGLVSDEDLEVHSDCATIECPQCFRSLGIVVFPNLADTEEAAARGNEAAIKALPEMRKTVNTAKARIERFEKECVKSVDQLPALAGDSLEFTWDIADSDGETYQIIRLGDVELWRELAFFDNIFRFVCVRALLQEKYGTRFKGLKYTDGSIEWLCGDDASKLGLLNS